MPKKSFKERTCHDCGLEAIDLCEESRKHFPAEEFKLPCNCCVRNPLKMKTLWRADFYHEQWRLDANKNPCFDDADIDPRAHELLRTMHLIMLEGVSALGK
jgi:hypothetical protein